jgi:hypothetical protein
MEGRPNLNPNGPPLVADSAQYIRLEPYNSRIVAAEVLGLSINQDFQLFETTEFTGYAGSGIDQFLHVEMVNLSVPNFLQEIALITIPSG